MKAGTAPVVKGFGPSLGEGGEEGAIIPAPQPPQHSALGLFLGRSEEKVEERAASPRGFTYSDP